MLDDLLSYLSPETILAMLADIEAVGDPDAIRRYFPELKVQLSALVGADEIDALLAANGIDPNANADG